MDCKPWHAIVLILLLLGFIETYHIHYHSHCPTVQTDY